MNRFLSVWNGIAFGVTLLFWLLVLFSHRIPYPWEEFEVVQRSAYAVTYGFAIGDLLYSLPLLLLGAIGLARKTSYGWTAAMIANALWIYSMTIIVLRDSFSAFSPGCIVFIPFLVVAVLSTPWLWKNRQLYGIQ